MSFCLAVAGTATSEPAGLEAKVDKLRRVSPYIFAPFQPMV
ncbi:MAG: hypothetical protein SVV80_00045 [Planctomycetota bacterium]|nr:hypothetical protein [Planctomycetota bacterium]